MVGRTIFRELRVLKIPNWIYQDSAITTKTGKSTSGRLEHC